MKYLWTVILILLSAAAYCSPVTLEYRHDGNEVNVYKELNVVTSNEDGVDLKMETVTEVTEKVVSPAPDLKLESTVKPVSIKVNGEDQDMSQAKENSFTYTLDRLGKVTSSYDSEGKAVEGFDASREIGLLPDKPVSKGDTWKGKLIMDTLNCPLECRLEEVSVQKGVEIARISFTADNTETVSDLLGDAMSELPPELNLAGSRTTRGSGTIYFSTKLGKVIMLEYSIDNHIELSAGGESMQTDEKVEYKMWRVK